MAVRDVVQAAAGVGGDKLYVEDVFSTYLYTGNGSTQTITNGIDLDGEGGLVWFKQRSAGGESHRLFDTERGATKSLRSNGTNGEIVYSDSLTSFNSNGFSLGAGAGSIGTNTSASTYASWTFRKAPKFFDVVTYTGNGVAGRTVAHNLGSTPGCVIVKRTDAATNWPVWHRGTTAGHWLKLNLTDASASQSTIFGNNSTYVNPTSTEFTVGTNSAVNASGGTYVAYLFAHDAGGFGDDGEQNVISCGSFTTDGSGAATVDLGWEPQWVLTKPVTGASNMDWRVMDNMRGITVDAGSAVLVPNSSNSEFTSGTFDYYPNGFKSDGLVNNTPVIYIAIRRGPMKTPESGTEVFAPVATSGSTGTTHNIGFPLDLQMSNYRTGSSTYVSDRLRGVDSTTNETAYPFLKTDSTSAEVTSVAFTRNVNNTSFQTPSFLTGLTQIYWNFRRAPGFFDVVCWTGDGTQNRSIAHNLTTTPEFVITKARNSSSFSWFTYHSAVSPANILTLNNANAANATFGPIVWGSTAFDETNFYVSGSSAGYSGINGSGTTYIAYLFASLPGVSKVGSYTGTGATQTINCGFSSGARFVLIKRTDSTGDWYVWDSARGIVAGNDPYLLLNSTAAEVTSTDYIDPVASGFEISSSAPAAINASGGTFIYLAIA